MSPPVKGVSILALLLVVGGEQDFRFFFDSTVRQRGREFGAAKAATSEWFALFFGMAFSATRRGTAKHTGAPFTLMQYLKFSMVATRNWINTFGTPFRLGPFIGPRVWSERSSFLPLRGVILAVSDSLVR